MRYVMKLGLVGIAVALSGCATQKQWSAYSGSRADGVVRLGYNYGMFEKPEIEPGQAQRLAAQKCSVWGYQSAEAFGDATQQCTATNQYGCVAWRVTAEFQCLGRGNSPVAAAAE